MSEYLVQDTNLTAIADAVRALDGSTSALTLDDIVSKLGTEKTNVEAALAALVEKEVDVPAGSTSAALASLIASIEAGGCITGTFTPSKYTDTVAIGSEIPDDNFFFAVVITVEPTKNTSSYILCGYFMCINGTISGVNVGTNKSISLGGIPDIVIPTIDRSSQTIKFTPAFSSGATFFEPSATFRWFLGGVT